MVSIRFSGALQRTKAFFCSGKDEDGEYCVVGRENAATVLFYCVAYRTVGVFACQFLRGLGDMIGAQIFTSVKWLLFQEEGTRDG